MKTITLITLVLMMATGCASQNLTTRGESQQNQAHFLHPGGHFDRL
jgi:uncharacterized protein YcfL